MTRLREGILAFAELRSTERVEPLGPVIARAEAAPAAGVLSGRRAFRWKKFVGTGTTLPVFNYVSPDLELKKDLVDQIFTSWNQLLSWLHQAERLRAAA